MNTSTTALFPKGLNILLSGKKWVGSAPLNGTLVTVTVTVTMTFELSDDGSRINWEAISRQESMVVDKVVGAWYPYDPNSQAQYGKMSTEQAARAPSAEFAYYGYDVGGTIGEQVFAATTSSPSEAEDIMAIVWNFDDITSDSFTSTNTVVGNRQAEGPFVVKFKSV